MHSQLPQLTGICRAGLTIVPFMPWHRAPRCQGDFRGHLLIFSYHITFYNYGSRPIRVCTMKTYWMVLPGCTSFRKHRALFMKRGPNPGPQDRVPEHLLHFTLRYGYSLWYDIIFVDNINVLDLALWADKVLKLNVLLCNL